jgi:hypothetical protein
MTEIQSNDVAFIVLMAGPGIPGDSILYLARRANSESGGSQRRRSIKNLLKVQRRANFNLSKTAMMMKDLIKEKLKRNIQIKSMLP